MGEQVKNGSSSRNGRGWRNLSELDGLAPTILSGGRPEIRLAESIDDLLSTNLRGHPWSRLVVAAALWGVRGDLDQVNKLLVSSLRGFTRLGDVTGQGYVAFVRGNVELGRGRLSEAARWWGRSRDLLQNRAPVEEAAIGNLALGAYDSGDLRGAVSLAEESLALARLRANWRTEAMVLAYLGFFHLNTGDFERAETALLRGLDAFAALENPEDAQEAPVCHMALGALHALRGEEQKAADEFERSRRRAEETSFPWFGALALAVRAEFLAHVDPRKSLADARQATSELKNMRDTWFQTWAMRAAGVASREAGDSEAAIQILHGVLDGPLNPIERARTLLAMGETLLANRRADAPGPLTEACDMFRSFGMDYWLARGLMVLARALPKSSRPLRREFRSLLREDPAYLRLASSNLRIQMLGNPGIFTDSGKIGFKTHRAEALVYALVIASERGLHWEELASRLWADVSSKRASSRLRTALWDARRALGPDAWRLERVKDIIRFDSQGICVDFFDMEVRSKDVLSQDLVDRGAITQLIAHLEKGLLVPWAYEDWVQEEDRGREALVDQLRQRIERIATLGVS